MRRSTLRLLCLFAVSLMLLVAWAFIDYVDLSLERIKLTREMETIAVERDALFDHTTYQTQQIDALTSHVDELEVEVTRMARLDATLRRVANLDSPGTGALMAGGISRVNPGSERTVQRNLDPTALNLRVDDLLDDAMSIHGSLAELDSYFADRNGWLASTPSIWPVRGWVSSEFGMRTDPFTGAPAMHEGLDIATAMGTLVLAPAGGVVAFVSDYGGYGNTVIIKHGQGVSTLYGHLSSTLVQPGQKVGRHDVIAAVGNSGRSTGPHLHYEVQINGVPVDPRMYILN